MKQWRLLFILMMLALTSSVALADKVIGEINAINIKQAEFMVEGNKYVLAQSASRSKRQRFLVELTHLRDGMLVEVNFKMSKKDRRETISISPLAH